MKVKAIAGIMLTLFLANTLCIVFNAEVSVTASPDVIRVPYD